MRGFKDKVVMNVSKFIILAMGVFSLSWILSAQPQPNIEYAGFVHNVLGDALLEESNGSLVVSNLGESGFDGVEVNLGSVGKFEMEWRDFSLASATSFTSIQMISRGTHSGDPAHEVLNFLLMQAFDSERGGFSGLEIAADYSDSGSQLYRFEVLQNGSVVESQVFDRSTIIARTQDGRTAPWPSKMSILGGDGGPIGYSFTWTNPLQAPVFVFIFRDNLAAPGNELRILAENQAVPLDQLSKLSMWIGDIPSFTITREEAK
jgi:hypothetical protein